MSNLFKTLSQTINTKNIVEKTTVELMEEEDLIFSDFVGDLMTENEIDNISRLCENTLSFKEISNELNESNEFISSKFN